MNQKANVQTEINSLSVNLRQKNKRTNEDYPGLTVAVCQNTLVPALEAGPQKNRPYQSVVYTVDFNAILRQAREQGTLYCSHTLTNNGLYILEMHSRASLHPNTQKYHTAGL